MRTPTKNYNKNEQCEPQQKTITKMSNANPNKKPGVNLGAYER